MAAIDMTLPWYRQVNRVQWKAFIGTFGGWGRRFSAADEAAAPEMVPAHR